MNLIQLNYDSTNYYLIQTNSGWLMIDTGWAGTLPKLLHLLKQKGINISEIKHLLITHFHPDHAGIAQEVKEAGASLLLHDCQVAYVSSMKKYFKPEHNFKEIEKTKNIVLTSAESRTYLSKLGIEGEIIPTPGHSDDSVTLIIDGCCAFTGDLRGLNLVDVESNPKFADSWQKIQSYQVSKIYPAHGNAFNI